MNIRGEQKFDSNSNLAVANSVISWFHDKDRSINNLHLQKLLYYLQVNYMYNHGRKKLFDNDFEKWKLGPVQPAVYHAFKHYGPNSINQTYKESNINFDGTDINIEEKEVVLDDQEKVDFINRNLEELSKYEKFELVDKTHKHLPWKKDENRILAGDKNIKYDYDELSDYFQENPSELLVSGENYSV